MRGILFGIALALAAIAAWAGSEYDMIVASGWAIGASIFFIAALSADDGSW